MELKFGITQWSLPGKGIYAVKYAAEAGLDGLQIELGSYEEGYYMAQPKIQKDYLEDAQEYGIVFPSIVLNDLGNHGFVGDKTSKDYKIAVESLELALLTAEAMKLDTIMIPQFWKNEIVDERTFENAAAVLMELCQKARKSGITIYSETTLRADRQIALMKAVGQPNLKTFYDSQNYYFFKGYSQSDTIEELYPYIGDQLHVKDCIGRDRMGGVLSGALLGTGDSDFKSTIRFLKKKDYAGWIILENYYYVKPLRDQGKDQFALIERDLEYLKRVLYE
ncbi:sugar phosphate isomerase/epimerase family protein [Christensenella timonensis]|uniref:sugar phosphate isomerase/epimerase family protein n=1 Tax=Christensenella timonensis TaxID=1816678 RepID=UPI00082A6FF6|nr:sugar phosphate isomerase/epimerase family protein [Christensenella timonensis]